jgi:hypothetical protein
MRPSPAPSTASLAGLVVFALLIAPAGCAPPAGDAKAPADSAAAAPDAGAPADTLLTLDRSTCFGPCPSYALTVFESGRVVYDGREYVEVKDTVRAQISGAKVERLKQQFRAADYFGYPRSYGRGDSACAVWRPDFPTVRTSFRTGGRRRQVEHYHGCYARRTEDGGELERAPSLARLAALEDTVDAIVGTARWTGE